MAKQSGGIIDVPCPNSLEFQDLARFAVDDYNHKHPDSNSALEFVNVLGVKEQIVDGIMYYITLEATDGGKKKKYEAKIWVKKWEDFKKVVEFNLVGDDGPKPGGIIDVSCENNLEFQDLARFAVDDYNHKHPNSALEFVNVLGVKEQIVDGIMYYITLEATDGGKKKKYEAKIWVKKWEDFKKVVEFNLVGDDGPKPGGIIDVSCENNLEFQDLARFAVDDYNHKHPNSVLEFVNVLGVKEQIVDGIMYYITLEATDGGKKKKYEAKIWVKEWEKFKEVQQFKQLLGDE
ncbi:multicystatin-like [Solanum dulcamara]|uniref:multicystatin-like n=1 Tax=Solanum dulcamara TaxID=45834 RepID=UPI00248688DC|nr:multicystatin-like [Solanum dulcamara]